MEFHRQQRFSIRKYAIGVASVLIGTFLMGSAVSADTIVPTPCRRAICSGARNRSNR